MKNIQLCGGRYEALIYKCERPRNDTPYGYFCFKRFDAETGPYVICRLFGYGINFYSTGRKVK